MSAHARSEHRMKKTVIFCISSELFVFQIFCKKLLLLDFSIITVLKNIISIGFWAFHSKYWESQMQHFKGIIFFFQIGDFGNVAKYF
jgi:hypothetical protein